jgi:hypothetical protein
MQQNIVNPSPIQTATATLSLHLTTGTSHAAISGIDSSPHRIGLCDLRSEKLLSASYLVAWRQGCLSADRKGIVVAREDHNTPKAVVFLLIFKAILMNEYKEYVRVLSPKWNNCFLYLLASKNSLLNMAPVYNNNNHRMR